MIRILSACATFLALCSCISVGTKYLTQHQYGEILPLMTVVLTSASIMGLVLGRRLEGVAMLPEGARGWLDMVKLALAGVLAATYFIVIAYTGAGSADMMESATTPLLLPLAAWCVRKKRPEIHGVVGGLIAFVGFGLLIYHPFNASKDVAAGTALHSSKLLIFVVFPILGAAGSAFSQALAFKLKNAGTGRHWCTGFKNLLAALVLVGLTSTHWHPGALTWIGTLAAVGLGLVINGVILMGVHVQDVASGEEMTLAITYLLLPFTSLVAALALQLEEKLLHFTWPFAVGLVLILVGGFIVEMWQTVRKNWAGTEPPFPPILGQPAV